MNPNAQYTHDHAMPKEHPRLPELERADALCAWLQSSFDKWSNGPQFNVESVNVESNSEDIYDDAPLQATVTLVFDLNRRTPLVPMKAVFAEFGARLGEGT
jgi:hypothetical protein